MKNVMRALIVVATLGAAPAFAHGVAMKEQRSGLLKKAKVAAADATATAQAEVPKGKIVSAEIEEEGGKLLFSFDVKTKGRSGIDEVTVDATTGEVIAVQHETPEDEAKEKNADRKKP